MQFHVFTSRLPAFHEFFNFENALLLSVHAGRDQGPARVRPRPDVQTLRRRVPRNGRDGPRAHALPVLQRLRLLAAAQQVAPRGHRRRRHVRRAGPGLGRHLGLVVQRAGPLEPPLPEHDVRLLGEHLDLQRQSALALRRLLHPLRHHRDPQPAAEGDLRPEPQAGRVVPGAGAARRSLPSRAEPDLLRPVLGGGRHLSMGGGLLDLVLPVPRLQALSAGEDRTVDRHGLAVGPDRDAALSTRQVLLRAREARKSEKSPHVRQPVRRDRDPGGRTASSPCRTR